MGGNNKPTTKKQFSRGEKTYIEVSGLTGVGKSSLTLRFVLNEFPDYYDPTIEDCYWKKKEIDGVEYNVEIHDTAGDDEFAARTRECHLVLVDLFVFVFSIDNIKSFEELPYKIEQTLKVQQVKFLNGIIIGNKKDLEDQRQVSRQIAKELADKYQIPYMETSAKTGENVDEWFENLIKFALHGVMPEEEMHINVKKAR